MNHSRESFVNEIAVKARSFDHAYQIKLNPLRGLRRAVRKVPDVVPYNPDARDGDGDGLRQEGTIWERPAGTRFFDALGRALGGDDLTVIPPGARIMDGDGNEFDYKPGDRSLNARGREGRRARRGQRRLRRGDRQMARADRNERRAGEIEKLDEQIALVDAAASDGSMERLIDAEEIRGDEPMDANYRGFWDNFIEGFTGVQQGRRRDQGEGRGARGGRRERLNRTTQRARRLEGMRRQAGDGAGNAPDREREREFDRVNLPEGADLDEHERRMTEEPGYRKRYIQALLNGREIEIDSDGKAIIIGGEHSPRENDPLGMGGVTDRPGARRPGGGAGKLIDPNNATNEEIENDIREQEGLVAREERWADGVLRPRDGDTRNSDKAYLRRLKKIRDRRKENGEWFPEDSEEDSDAPLDGETDVPVDAPEANFIPGVNADGEPVDADGDPVEDPDEDLPHQRLLGRFDEEVDAIGENVREFVAEGRLFGSDGFEIQPEEIDQQIRDLINTLREYRDEDFIDDEELQIRVDQLDEYRQGFESFLEEVEVRERDRTDFAGIRDFAEGRRDLSEGNIREIFGLNGGDVPGRDRFLSDNENALWVLAEVDPSNPDSPGDDRARLDALQRVRGRLFDIPDEEQEGDAWSGEEARIWHQVAQEHFGLDPDSVREREQVDAINLPEEVRLDLSDAALRNMGNDPEDGQVTLQGVIRGDGMSILGNDTEGNIFNPSTARAGDAQGTLNARRMIAISATSDDELELLVSSGTVWPESWGPEPTARDWIDEGGDTQSLQSLLIAQAYAEEYLRNRDFSDGQGRDLAEAFSNNRQRIMRLSDEQLSDELNPVQVAAERARRQANVDALPELPETSESQGGGTPDPEAELSDVELEGLVRGDRMPFLPSDMKGTGVGKWNIWYSSATIPLADSPAVRERRKRIIEATSEEDLRRLLDESVWPAGWGPVPESRDWIDQPDDINNPADKPVPVAIARAYAREFLENGNFALSGGRGDLLANHENERRRLIMGYGPDELDAELGGERAQKERERRAAIAAALPDLPDDADLERIREEAANFGPDDLPDEPVPESAAERRLRLEEEAALLGRPLPALRNRWEDIRAANDDEDDWGSIVKQRDIPQLIEDAIRDDPAMDDEGVQELIDIIALDLNERIERDQARRIEAQEMPSGGVAGDQYHVERLQAMSNMSDSELEALIERQSAFILENTNSDEIFRRHVAAQDLMRARVALMERGARPTPNRGDPSPLPDGDDELAILDDEGAWRRDMLSLLNLRPEWNDEAKERAERLVRAVNALEGNDVDIREAREIASYLQHRLDNDGRDDDGLFIGIMPEAWGDLDGRDPIVRTPEPEPDTLDRQLQAMTNLELLNEIQRMSGLSPSGGSGQDRFDRLNAERERRGLEPPLSAVDDVAGVSQENFDPARFNESVGGAIEAHKRTIKSFRRRINHRREGDRVRPNRGNDAYHMNRDNADEKVARIEGHEANAARGLADVERRLRELPAGADADLRRQLQGLKRSYRNLQEKIAAERSRREARRDLFDNEGREARRKALAKYELQRNRVAEWENGVLEAEIEALLASGAGEAEFEELAGRLNATVEGEVVDLARKIPNGAFTGQHEGGRPEDARELADKIAEFKQTIKEARDTNKQLLLFRSNKQFVAANESRLEEIKNFIDNLPVEQFIPESISDELRQMREDHDALGRMGVTGEQIPNVPDSDKQDWVDRKMAIDTALGELSRNNEQRINAGVAMPVIENQRQVLEDLYEFRGAGGDRPRFRDLLDQIEGDLENATSSQMALLDGPENLLQNILNEITATPNVDQIAAVNNAKEALKIEVEEHLKRIKSLRKSYELGGVRGNLATAMGVNNEVLVGGRGARQNVPGIGLPSELDENGFVRIKRVPVGNANINNQSDANRYVRSGGDLSEVPDEFVGFAVLMNSSGLEEDLSRDGGFGDRVVDAGAGDDGDSRFVVKAANGGQMSTTYVLVQRRDDGTLGPEGVFIKVHREEDGGGGNGGDGNRGTVGELMAADVIHRLGAPTMPGREDGKMMLRTRHQSGNRTHGRAVLLSHGLNVDADAEAATNNGEAGIRNFRDGIDSLSEAENDASLEGRVVNAVTNLFLGVADRHGGNGLFVARSVFARDENGEIRVDVNGNNIVESAAAVVMPIDLSWVGKNGVSLTSSGLNRYFWGDRSWMDPNLSGIVREFAQNNPERKEAVAEMIREMGRRMEAIINDPNYIEGLFEFENDMGDDLNVMKTRLREQFAKIAPNGTVDVTAILDFYGLN